MPAQAICRGEVVLTHLFRYPVKSMIGERLREASITRRGVAGDRGWALLDPATGLVVSAKHPRKWRRMLQLTAHIAGGDGLVEVRFPSGRAVRSDERDIADRALSDFLGRQVRLVDAAPQLAVIERDDPDQGGALTGTVTTGRIGSSAPGGEFLDHGTLHVVTAATLRRLHELGPQHHFPPARFRPNMVLDVPSCSEFAEDGWQGKVIHVGAEVVLRVQEPTPRCAVPTLAQTSLDEDPGVIATIARHHRIPIEGLGPRPCVGAYAEVLHGGTVHEGDRVTLVPGRSLESGGGPSAGFL